MGEAVTVKWFVAGGIDQLPGKAEANPGRTLFITNRELFYTRSTFFFFSSQKR